MKTILLTFLFFGIFISQTFSQEIELYQVDNTTFLDRTLLKEYLSIKYEAMKPKMMQFQRLLWEEDIQKWEAKTDAHTLTIVKKTKYKDFPMEIYLDGKVLPITKEMLNMHEYLSEAHSFGSCIYVYEYDGREIIIIEFSGSAHPIYLIDTHNNATFSITTDGGSCSYPEYVMFLMKKVNKNGISTLFITQQYQSHIERYFGKYLTFNLKIFKMYNTTEKKYISSDKDTSNKSETTKVKESFFSKHPAMDKNRLVFNFSMQQKYYVYAANLISYSVSYKIKSGDTITSITKNMGITLQNLLDLNKNIKDKDDIKEGQEIIVYITK